MRFTNWSTPVLGVALLMASSAPARSEVLGPGTLELSPMFDFSHSSFSANGTDEGSITTVNLNTGIGYCASTMFEPVGSLVLSHTSFTTPGFFASSTTSGTGAGALAGLILNFPASGAMIPFVEAQVGFISYSGDLYSGSTQTAGTLPAVSAGARWMVGHNGSVNFALTYQHVTNFGGQKDLNANDISFGVGVSLFPIRN